MKLRKTKFNFGVPALAVAVTLSLSTSAYAATTTTTTTTTPAPTATTNSIPSDQQDDVQSQIANYAKTSSALQSLVQSQQAAAMGTQGQSTAGTFIPGFYALGQNPGQTNPAAAKDPNAPVKKYQYNGPKAGVIDVELPPRLFNNIPAIR